MHPVYTHTHTHTHTHTNTLGIPVVRVEIVLQCCRGVVRQAGQKGAHDDLVFNVFMALKQLEVSHQVMEERGEGREVPKVDTGELRVCEGGRRVYECVCVCVCACMRVCLYSGDSWIASEWFKRQVGQ